MTHRDSPQPLGTPTWIDFWVHDSDAASAFFSGLFGWQVPPGDPAFNGYATATLDGRDICGFGPAMPGMPEGDVIQVYLATPDINDTFERAIAAGATALMPEPHPVGDHGHMAVLTDPAGAVFGLWQADKMIGTQTIDEPGAPCWHETLSRDIEKSKAFYRDVFALTIEVEENAEGYHIAKNEQGHSLFGLMEMPTDAGDAPSCWYSYFAVPDRDTAVANITAAGGQELSSGDWPGKWAIMASPQGAMFAVFAEPQQG